MRWSRTTPWADAPTDTGLGGTGMMVAIARVGKTRDVGPMGAVLIALESHGLGFGSALSLPWFPT
jgi:hypothetical protein